MRFVKFQIVEFKNVGGVNVPTKPWPQVFYISDFRFVEREFEFRPLTLVGFLKGVGKNFISMNYWRFMYLLYKAGFLAPGESEAMSWSHWRWSFWKKGNRT